MRHGAAEWLRRHAPDAPASLVARMDRAVQEAARAHPRLEAADALGQAALSCLREALEQCDERAAALPLLAADALITAACEHAAERGPDHVLALARRFAPAALEPLVAS